MNYKLKKQYRCVNYDYSLNGSYFVTICTQDKKHYFGKIENYKVVLSPLGKIAVKFWQEVPQHFVNIKLDEFIVMPNHIHGIVILEDKSQLMFKNKIVGTGHCPVHQNNQNERTRQCRVPTMQKTNFGPLKPGSISTIIGSYKSKVSKTIHQQYSHVNFSWQPRFYDRIIRNQQEFHNIQKYIYFNPLNWKKDELLK